MASSYSNSYSLWQSPLEARFAGATPQIVRQELNAAIQEFYFQSRAWREQIGPYTVTAAQANVTLNPVQTHAKVVFVHQAWIEDPDNGVRGLKALTVYPTDGQTDYPTHYYAADPLLLRLWPTPDATLGTVLYADAALAPLSSTAQLPSVAASHHFEAILEGSLARLFLMPNKPWTDLMQAAVYTRSFRRRCMEFRAISDSGYTRADPPWRFPPFA